MDEKYMRLAYLEAKKAYKKNEVPVGAIIVKKNKVISKAHNLIETKKDSTKHAEIIAISKASKKLRNWRLIDCDLYVTLEPCEMCKGAINLSRIKNVYFAVSRKSEVSKSKCNYFLKKSNTECLDLIKDFFYKIRH